MFYVIRKEDSGCLITLTCTQSKFVEHFPSRSPGRGSDIDRTLETRMRNQNKADKNGILENDRK